MKLWCMIQIVFNVNGINFIQNEPVLGKLLVNDKVSEYYLMDFSEQAKKEKYIGDYSQILVKKESCVKL